MTWRITPALLILLVLALAACSQEQTPVAGTYRATTDGTEIVLTLNKDGKGTWSTDLDEITFKWTTRAKDEIWIHSREGGVIQGKIKNSTLRLSLPGTDTLIFERD